jgi:hypothetical protein
MIYLSQDENLLLFSTGFILFYIVIAGWSFKYYAIKSNSPSTVVENFIKRLHFPASLVLPLATRLAGKEFTNTNLRQAQGQRILLLIIVSIFHIPIVIGAFHAYDLFFILYSVTFLLVSPIIIFFCMRFGHQLLTAPNSVDPF